MSLLTSTTRTHKQLLPSPPLPSPSQAARAVDESVNIYDPHPFGTAYDGARVMTRDPPLTLLVLCGCPDGDLMAADQSLGTARSLCNHLQTVGWPIPVRGGGLPDDADSSACLMTLTAVPA